MVGLPCAIALYPQRACSSVDDLEESFRNLKDAKDKRIDKAYFNRGL